MENLGNITLSGFAQQILVGLSRTTILFIVSSGLSLVLGVLRIPNIAHGSLYMIGAFLAYSIATLFGGGSTGFWLSLVLAPVGVAIISLAVERGIFCRLYDREHLMLLLFTFALMLFFKDAVKLVWGSDYRSLAAPSLLEGSFSIFNLPFPRYNVFLLIVGPLVAVRLWLLTNKTKIGKISHAAAVDRDMVGAVGINVSWVFAFVFVIGCFHRGIGWRIGSSDTKHHPRHGPHHYHGSLPDRHYRRIGKYLGSAAGCAYLRPDRFYRDPGVASIRHCFPVCRGGDSVDL